MFLEDTSIENATVLIDYFRSPRPTSDIVKLTEALANSGSMLSSSNDVADIPSTGGPSSLSTILCPPFLVSLGYKVRKLGVPGRPAGGLDSLAQIYGYKTSFTPIELSKILSKKYQYVHLDSSDTFAPADSTLFSIRKKLGAIDIPQLAIASILSKKLSMGINAVVLDVRASRFGNFGHTVEECRKNATIFCDVAERFGIKAHAVICESTIPFQPYIGRLESLQAVYQALFGRADEWLSNHIDYCMNLCGILGNSVDSDLYKFRDMFIDSARQAFIDNLELQGSSYELFKKKIATPYVSVFVEADSAGFASYDLREIRKLIVDAQDSQAASEVKYPDPLGMVLLAKPGDKIFPGDKVLEIRSRCSDSKIPDCSACFSISDKAPLSYSDRYIEVL